MPCFLSKGPFKEEFLDIDLTTFFGALNFGNTSTMKVIFFWKMLKPNINFKNAKKKKKKKKIGEKFFVFEIIASESVALNCHY